MAASIARPEERTISSIVSFHGAIHDFTKQIEQTIGLSSTSEDAKRNARAKIAELRSRLERARIETINDAAAIDAEILGEILLEALTIANDQHMGFAQRRAFLEAMEDHGAELIRLQELYDELAELYQEQELILNGLSGSLGELVRNNYQNLYAQFLQTKKNPAPVLKQANKHPLLKQLKTNNEKIMAWHMLQQSPQAFDTASLEDIIYHVNQAIQLGKNDYSVNKKRVKTKSIEGKLGNSITFTKKNSNVSDIDSLMHLDTANTNNAQEPETPLVQTTVASAQPIASATLKPATDHHKQGDEIDDSLGEVEDHDDNLQQTGAPNSKPTGRLQRRSQQINQETAIDAKEDRPGQDL